MNKEEQHRFCIFCVLVAMSCIFSVVYAYMVYNTMRAVGDFEVYDGKFIIDGEDFAPFIKVFEIIFKIMARGIMALIFLMFGVLSAVIVNVLAFGYLSELTLRKSLYISKKGISLTQMVIWGTLIIELILTVILIQKDFLWVALLLFWQMPLFANFLYLWKMKKQYKKITQY